MHFDKSENQQMVIESAKQFAEKHIRPNIMKWDETQEFPVEIFKKLGELGMMGVLIPEKYGGSGFGYFEYVDIIDQISQVDPSIGLSLAAHNSLCSGHIMSFGNEKQKEKYLPKLATAEHIGAWGLTEPNTGSDAANMKTVAEKKGDHYVLNGTKNFITHGKSGDVAVVIARTGEKGDSRGMSAFIVEKGTPGFSAGKKEDKLGMRASETTEIVFEDCEIPEENLLGKEGEGFIQAMQVLDGGRISIAALSLGTAKGAYYHALKYSQERHQFDKPISSFQGISFKLADMETQIDASDLLTHQAAYFKNQGQASTKLSSMAKYYASECAIEVTRQAVQIHGGYGFIKEFPVEKFYRDVKLCTIGEGTTEIQKLVIARELLKS